MAPRSRICLIGPESTGKTELAGRLAAELGWPWVAEFPKPLTDEVCRPPSS